MGALRAQGSFPGDGQEPGTELGGGSMGAPPLGVTASSGPRRRVRGLDSLWSEPR